MQFLQTDVPAKDALDQIVRRYIHLVYSAALRQSYGNVNSAADVTQGVMIVLVTKFWAGKLPKERQMAGWLLIVTRNTVYQFRRAAARRVRYEAGAGRQNQSEGLEPSDGDLRAALDRALIALNPIDREVIARRYLQDQSLAEIGIAVGMNENTTGRRVARAIEKLRKMLEPGGIKVPTLALITMFGAEAAIKAPAVCASVAAPGGLSSELANRILRRMAVTKISASIAMILGTLLMLSGVVTAVVVLGTKQVAGVPPTTSPTVPHPGPIALESETPVDGPSDAILKETLAGLLANQGKLRSIHVVGSTINSMYNPNKKAWTDLAKTDGEAWSEVAPPRRERAVVTHGQSLIVNENGFSPLQNASFVEAWNGTTLYRQYGPPDSDPAAETFVTRYLKGDVLLGADFSMQLSWDIETAQDSGGSRTTINRNPLGAATLSQMKLSARHVKLQSGIAATELTVNVPDDRVTRTEVFWFDAHRGYGLLARRDTLAINGMEVQQIIRRIDGLVEAAPGVFYPSRAQMYWEQRGMPVVWSEFEATKVIGNEKQPDAFFEPAFPAGMQITDFDKNGRGTKRAEN